jgi:hypothetical protein
MRSYDNDRRREREEKRLVKKLGKRARRRALKRSLDENPEEADLDDYRFRSGESSKDLNRSPYDRDFDE